MIKVKVPGKLYLVGEYAILAPKSQAVAVAVDRFLTVTLTPLETAGQLETALSDHVISWAWEGTTLTSPDHKRFDLVFSAIEVVARYVGRYDHFRVQIHSELDATDGTKLGLGSSGAVSVAIVRALGEYYGLWSSTPNDNERTLIFKLAALSQYQAGYHGSYGDLAAIAYTGMVRYRNFDHDFLATGVPLTGAALRTWLTESWPGLAIERLHLPAGWHFLVAWTKQAASTDTLIQQENNEMATAPLKANQPQYFPILITQSQAIIDRFVAGISSVDWPSVSQALYDNAEALMNYTAHVGKPYLTSLAAKSVQMARQYGAMSKISGAGGGDCVIALAPKTLIAKAVIEQWQKHHIPPLALTIYEEVTG